MNRADSLLSRWLNHRKVLHELLEAIGNEHTHYKPWKKAFSLGSLAIHIGTSSSHVREAVKEGAFPQMGRASLL